MTVLSEANLNLIKKASQFHTKTFKKIQENIPTETKIGSFIYFSLGDFMFDIDEKVLNNPSFEINYYWENDANLYAQQLLDDIKDARNSIINLFLMYIDNKKNLEYYSPDEMNDYTEDYVLGFGTGSITYHFKDQEERLSKLSEIERTVLNYYLSKTGFNEIN